MRSIKILLLLFFGMVPVLAEDSPRSDVSARLEEAVGSGLNADLSTGRPFSLPPGVEVVADLSESDAVAIALWNSPGLEVALAELDLARADLVQAGVLVNPSFDALIGIGVKPWEFLFRLPLQAFWQRPHRRSAAELNLEMISENLVQSGIDLVRDTRIAFAELVSARERADRNVRLSELLNEVAELTGRLQAAGDISELDAKLVQLDAVNSASLAARSVQEIDVAELRLKTLMGAKDALAVIKVVQGYPVLASPPSEGMLVELALQSRPDLRAAELAIRAAGERAGWEKSRVFNMVSAGLSSKEIGDSGFKTGPGVSVEIPIFDRNQGRISRADAEVNRATLQYLELIDRVKSEVRLRRVRLLQASDQLEHWRTGLLPVVLETVELAKSAYSNGDISYLELQKTRRPLLEANAFEVVMVLDLQKALIELERAVGRRL